MRLYIEMFPHTCKMCCAAYKELLDLPCSCTVSFKILLKCESRNYCIYCRTCTMELSSSNNCIGCDLKVSYLCKIKSPPRAGCK